MRIAFLFNHDHIHQVAHALPTAIELSRLAPQVETIVATTSHRLTDEVRRLSAGRDARFSLVELGLGSRFTRFAARRLETVLPFSKLAVYRDNLPFFRSLDALVVAEKTSLLLKTRYGLGRLKIIHTRHGAGDRAIGFDRVSALFDHVLASGPKIRDRLISEAGVAPDRISVIGYPKFDLLPTRPVRLPFQDNGRPTVLYNPHPSPHLSSWYRDGRAVLEHFVRDNRYNLIFAPHVMLFHRRFVLTIDKLRIDRPGLICDSVMRAPNIHVDLGSRASTDMTYTQAADIYLGDVSSQVYEYLIRPRPCLFLDSHGANWRRNPDYVHWQAGEVLSDPSRLGEALDRAVAGHADYAGRQREMVRDSFDLDGQPSSVRAARAVLAALGRPAPLVSTMPWTLQDIEAAPRVAMPA